MSHNPIFNQAVRTGIAASEMTPVEVDQEFGRITGKRMTMEGTTSKVIGMLLAVLIGAGVTWFFGLYGFVLPAMLVGLGLGLWASFSKTVRPGVMMAYALVQGSQRPALPPAEEAQGLTDEQWQAYLQRVKEEATCSS